VLTRPRQGDKKHHHSKGEQRNLPRVSFNVSDLRNAMKRIALIVSVLVCLGGLNGVAGEAQKINRYRAVLSEAAPAELPAKAAELVKRAKVRDRGATTVDVVQAALEANPGSACAVVSSISKVVPSMAPAAAGAASQLQPKEAIAIAKAAARAAPSEAAKVVVAVSRAVPSRWRLVAAAVGEVVPGSNQAILAGLAAAFPESSPGISEALSGYTGDVSSVGSVLDQAVAAPSLPTGIRGPSIGSPYTLGNGTPSDINGLSPGTSTLVPPGGASYAAP